MGKAAKKAPAAQAPPEATTGADTPSALLGGSVNENEVRVLRGVVESLRKTRKDVADAHEKALAEKDSELLSTKSKVGELHATVKALRQALVDASDVHARESADQQAEIEATKRAAANGELPSPMRQIFIDATVAHEKEIAHVSFQLAELRARTEEALSAKNSELEELHRLLNAATRATRSLQSSAEEQLAVSAAPDEGVGAVQKLWDDEAFAEALTSRNVDGSARPHVSSPFVPQLLFIDVPNLEDARMSLGEDISEVSLPHCGQDFADNHVRLHLSTVSPQDRRNDLETEVNRSQVSFNDSPNERYDVQDWIVAGGSSTLRGEHSHIREHSHIDLASPFGA